MTRRAAIEAALDRLAPGLPAFERAVVADHALDSLGLRRAAPETAAWLSLVAYARHAMTDYDDLLDEGYDRDAARHFVLDALNEALAGWACRRRVDGSEAGDDEDEGPDAEPDGDRDDGGDPRPDPPAARRAPGARRA